MARVPSVEGGGSVARQPRDGCGESDQALEGSLTVNPDATLISGVNVAVSGTYSCNGGGTADGLVRLNQFSLPG